MDRLEADGYVDDRRTAREFATGRLRREPLGRRRLAAELARRGAAEEVVSEVVEEMLPGDDRETARQAAEVWLGRRGKSANPASLARYLERRGFSAPAIWAMLEEFDPGGDLDD